MTEGKRQPIKYAPPPSDLPIYQRVNPKDVSFIGRTNYEAALEAKKFIFGLKREDRKRHLYIVGKNGTGKTKLLELLIRQDIGYGYGCCLFDPNGDLMESVLEFIPAERIHDVVMIDPTDREFAPVFNPLSNVPDELRHQTAQGVVEAMERQFTSAWTPRLEHITRFAILALLDYPEANLSGMIALLTDQAYRANVVPHIKDEMVARFWEVEFTDWQSRFAEDTVMPLLTKLEQLLASPFLYDIFVQTENKIDFDTVLAENQILLVNLSRSKLGEDGSNFLGSLLLTKLYLAAANRPLHPKKPRKDFYFYIDEFHGLVTNTFERFYAEARRYGIANTVVNQYTGQVADRTKQLVLANSDTIIVFRVGGEDAAWLENEMTPVFKARDMINLGTQEFYIKMIIDGNTNDPFSASTLEVFPPPYETEKHKIIALNYEKYATAKSIISRRKPKQTQPAELVDLDAAEEQIEEEVRAQQQDHNETEVSLDQLPIKK